MANADMDRQFENYVVARTSVLRGTAIRLMAGDRNLADDLVQVTLLKAYLSWGRVRDEQLRDAYVRRIMVREAARLSARERRELPLDTCYLASADASEGVEQRLVIWELLRGLSNRQRAAIVLRYYHDLPLASVADELGCSEGAVKSHLSRARQSLAHGWRETYLGKESL